jgi:ATP-binding cassette subfamily F protein 3
VSLLEFSSLVYGYTDVRIVAQASGALHPGNVVGLVGANGCGKTTLLRLLLGEFAPEAGNVQRSKALKLAYVPQVAEGRADNQLYTFVKTGRADLESLQAMLDELKRQLAMSPDSEHLLEKLGVADERFTALGGHRWEHDVERLLLGLSFHRSDFAQPLEQLSGGQRQKACLARALLSGANCFVFDEPTNHLDLAAQQFFCNYLQELPNDCAVLLVSHDRWLLDALCTHTWELEDGVLHRYPQCYSKAAPLRDERRMQARLAFERQREHITRTEDYIRRNIAGQNTRQARGRRKLLNRMERLEQPSADPAMSFVLTPSLRSGEQVLIIENLAFSYGEPNAAVVSAKPDTDAVSAAPGTHVPAGPSGLDLNPPLTVARSQAIGELVIDKVGFTLYRGECLGIIGPNGCGKTTLLKLLARQLGPLRGMVAWGANAELGVFSQDSADLVPGRDVMAELRSVEPTITDSAARDYLARFGFSGDDVFAEVSTLSGGERSRLTLAKIFRRRPNVLLLDEPTNHLDIYAREALEQFLGAFSGSVVMVTHDRALLSRICNRLVVFPFGAEGERTVAFFRGGYEDYLTWRARQDEELDEPSEQVGTKQHESDTPKSAEPDPSRPEMLSIYDVELLAREAHTSVEGYLVKQQVRAEYRGSEIESRIAALEDSVNELREQQYAADRAQEYDKLGELQEGVDALNKEIEVLFVELELVHAAVEAWQKLAAQV